MNNQIRYSVYDGDVLIAQTEWLPERTKDDAPNALTDVRKRLGGNYAYRIERTGDSKQANKIPMVRYRIKVKDNVFYSRGVYETEKEKARQEIESTFPDSEITEEVI
jgi:hypothetical protein